MTVTISNKSNPPKALGDYPIRPTNISTNVPNSPVPLDISPETPITAPVINRPMEIIGGSPDQTPEQVVSVLDTTYKSDEGYNVEQALLNKDVSPSGLVEAGFSQDDVSNAVKNVQNYYQGINKQEQITDKLSKYKSNEGYDINSAIYDKAITSSELSDIGINQDEISKANDFVDKNFKLVTGEWISRSDWEAIPSNLKYLYLAYGSKIPEEKYSKALETLSKTTSSQPSVKTIQPKGLAQSLWWGMTPWKEETGEKASAKGVGIMSAEFLVPGVYSARHWSEMGNGGRALSIGMDVLSLIPVAGAVGRGAREASVLVEEGIRAATMARIAAAGRAGASELTRQILFPVELAKSVGSLAKPVKLAGKAGEEAITLTGTRAITENTRSIIKATGGKIKASLSSIETLVHPMKLPESVVTDTYHTIKIPLSKFETVEDAFKARTQIMEAAAKPGNKIVVDVGDSVITIKRSPLMRELGGGIAHSTPSGEALVTGLVVEWKKGMPLREQGLFMSPEAATRFAETSAYGIKGSKPAIVIMSPEMAAKAKTTTKLYKGVTEMEAIYPVGTEIPKPKQTLFTRLGDTGQRIEIQLGKKLTMKQIYKLKAEGLIEQVKNIYQPSITLTSKSGKGLTEKEALKLADIIETSDSKLARNIRIAASDPEGLLRVLTRMQDPVAYRTSTYRDGNKIKQITTTIPRRKGETNVDYIDRANREANRSTISIREATREITTSEPIRETTRLAPTEDNIGIANRADNTIARVEPSKGISRSRDRVDSTIARVESPRATTRERANANRVSANKTSVKSPQLKRKAKEVKDLSEKELKGAITWRQGQLHGKDVWIVLYPPYKDENKIYVMGIPPFGVKRAEGLQSAYKTIQIVKGETREPVNVDIGAFKVNIPKSPKGKVGKRMKFTKDNTASISSSR